MRALVASMALLLAGCVGPAGRTSLVRLDRCAEGGAKVFAGVDDDGDGILAAAEVDSTADLDCREPPPGVAALKHCRQHADCAAIGGYCASDDRCHPVEPAGACEQATGAAARDPHGPTIFDAGQDTIGDRGHLCKKDPVSCPNEGNVCQFSLQWADPEMDVEAKPAALHKQLRLFRGLSPAQRPHDLPVVEKSAIRFTLCVDEAASDVTFAAQLVDNAGHPSNALCFTGSTP